MKAHHKRALVTLVCLFMMGFVLSSFAEDAELNGNDSINTLPSYFNPNNFIMCQKLLTTACGSAQTNQQFNLCLARINSNHACDNFSAFAKQVNFNRGDNIDRYQLYGQGRVTLLHLTRAGANYPGDYFIIDAQRNILEVSKLITTVDITTDENFKQIFYQFPKAALWPSINNMPKTQSSATGDFSLVFQVPLLNGCQTCERAGTAQIGFNFTKTGEFAGANLVALQPNPTP